MKKTSVLLSLLLLMVAVSACHSAYDKTSQAESGDYTTAPGAAFVADTTEEASRGDKPTASPSAPAFPDSQSSPQPTDGQNQMSALVPRTLSEMVYPETILLSENYWTATALFSPIDHDYNKQRLHAYHIDTFAGEFEEIWRQELAHQYEKTMSGIPEEYRAQLAWQQASWEAYFDNDVFPGIAMTIEEETGHYVGEGFVREARLIRLDRVRARTIEILQLQTHIAGMDIAFHYKAEE